MMRARMKSGLKLEAEYMGRPSCDGAATVVETGCNGRLHGECCDSIRTQERTEMVRVGGGWCSESVSIS